MLKKNEIISLTITDINSEGVGVGHIDGRAVFVPFTLTGEVVKVRIEKVLKNLAHARVVEIEKPSSARTEPDCEAFFRCGGCAFRHMTYEKELAAKLGTVNSAFKRIGGLDITAEKILPSPSTERYRNKAQFVVRRVDGALKTGFFAPRSHRFVPIEDCKLQPNIFNRIANTCCRYFDEMNLSCYDEVSGKGDIRHLLLRCSGDETDVMVCVVLTRPAKLSPLYDLLCKSFKEKITLIENINPNKTNVILGRKNTVIGGDGHITTRLFADSDYDVSYDISPHSFFQVNTKGAEGLYEVVREFAALKTGERVLDLYCGVGSIGMSICSKEQSLVGVDIVESAISAAKKTADKAGFIDAEFICADAHVGLSGGAHFDLVIVDPPRKGLDARTCELLLECKAERIVMVSCNPSTAARDAALLSVGYKVERLKAVDMFPRCAHVETCVLLSHKDPQNCY